MLRHRQHSMQKKRRLKKGRREKTLIERRGGQKGGKAERAVETSSNYNVGELFGARLAS